MWWATSSDFVLTHDRNIFRPKNVFLRTDLTLIALATAIATPSLAAGPEVADFTLPNGVELVVIPDHRAPVVTHMIWYKVGAADETPGKSGLAHFLEHLMFKGTAKNPAGKFSQVVARIGGQENAFTSQDYTGYYQRVPSDQLKTVMEFEADRMTGLQLTDDVVLPERNVILEEQNQRIGNNPRARLGEQIDAALYLNNPYGKPVIGWRHEMEELSRDDAIGFYRRFYAPNNAVVVIAGDVDPAKARALAEETYGKIPRHGNMAPRCARRSRRRWPREHSRSRIHARKYRPLQREYLVPSFATGKRGESTALEVLAHILGSGSNSRLYLGLVVDKQVAVAANAWYDASTLDLSKFTVGGSPRPGVTLPQLEAETDAIIAQVIEKGVTPEELERAKTRLIADAVYAQDNQATMARWFGTALTTGASVNDVKNWPDRIRAVTAEQVQDAARQWLDKRRSVTGYLIKDVSPQAEKRS